MQLRKFFLPPSLRSFALRTALHGPQRGYDILENYYVSLALRPKLLVLCLELVRCEQYLRTSAVIIIKKCEIFAQVHMKGREMRGYSVKPVI
jgi:hypothetical protein